MEIIMMKLMICLVRIHNKNNHIPKNSPIKNQLNHKDNHYLLVISL